MPDGADVEWVYADVSDAPVATARVDALEAGAALRSEGAARAGVTLSSAARTSDGVCEFTGTHRRGERGCHQDFPPLRSALFGRLTGARGAAGDVAHRGPT